MFDSGSTDPPSSGTAGNADPGPSLAMSSPQLPLCSLPPGVNDTAARGALVMPSSAQLTVALAQATTLAQLTDFDAMMSVLEEAGKQFQIAIGEAIHFAACHLQGKRKLGLALMQLVGHGGDRSSSQRASGTENALSRRIDKDRRCRYKALARVPDEVFEGYLQARAEQHMIPREAGVLRYAASAMLQGRTKRPPRTRGAKPRGVLPLPVLDAVQRVLGDIDVCVGEAAVRCRLRAPAEAPLPQRLRGTVFVADCRDPGVLLPALAALHAGKQVREAVVVLPLTPGARWFRELFEHGWVCCFVTTSAPLLLAHLGPHYAFAIACSEVGVVLGKTR